MEPPDPTPTPDATLVSDAYRRGLEAFAAGDLDVAVERLEVAVAAAPDDLVVGTDYRQAIIALADRAEPGTSEARAPYDRALAFFERLSEAHPESANAELNLGFAHVDKVPTASPLASLGLASGALRHFTAAIDRQPSWLGYYARGQAALFWPPAFGKTPEAITDLERANELADAEGEPKPHHALGWITLGDGHWRAGDPEAARRAWRQGLDRFPDDVDLRVRTSENDPSEIDALLDHRFDPRSRVETHLREIYGDRLAPFRGALESAEPAAVK